VGEAPVWFESTDAELAANPEAFASAFLIPSLRLRRPLRVEDDLCEEWLRGSEAVLRVCRRWWRYASRPPEAARVVHHRRLGRAATGLCFTGGVDSFHALLCGGYKPALLVFAHGYDIPLVSEQRMAAFDESLRAVGEERGCGVAVIRTTLREHPLFRKESWSRSHGGALAALGHLLAARIDRLVIPSSWSYDNAQPWGSSWRLDPHWSSSRLEVVHSDASLWRTDKLLRIAQHPLVAQHLRVCWENRAPIGNCSRCEKCVRTMLALETCGKLGSFGVFDRSDPLAERVDALPPLPVHQFAVYEDLIARGLAPELERAVRRLLGRSERRERAWVQRLRRKLRGERRI
jgi:hypothetical protein